jgi:hypothetical protein
MGFNMEYHGVCPSQIGDDPHVDVIYMEYCRYTLVGGLEHEFYFSIY